MTAAEEGARFGLWYHLRNPARWHRRPEELYRQAIDQAAWAEQIGFDSIWATEHHFEDDGYVPSPLLFLASVAARTSRVRLATNIVIAPLHHPLRLAEDSATLAILSGGRFALGVAIGYRESEFEAFGRRLSQRSRLMEEQVDILRRAWSGTSVRLDGQQFTVPDVRVTPIPSRPPMLLMGGRAPAAVDRAARLADGYLPSSRPGQKYELFDRYLEAVDRIGGDRAAARIMCSVPAIIAADPERELARVGPHVLHQVNGYIAKGTYGDVSLLEAPEDAIKAGYLDLWDADLAVSRLSATLAAYPQIKDLHWWAQFPGESAESGSERASYLAERVLPALRAATREQISAPGGRGAGEQHA